MSHYNDTVAISTTNSAADDLDIPFDMRRGACGKVFHPLAHKLFPPMSAQEFEELVESIKTGALHDPIVIYDGMIIDGRHRALACEIAGIEPLYTTVPPGADPLQFVLDRNLCRRHLSESQRAMVATRVANMKLGDNQHTGGSANL